MSLGPRFTLIIYVFARRSFDSIALMRYTSDSLVAQRNFPSLYIKQQKFLLFSWLEKKNATGITTTKRKVFLFLLLLCLLLRVFVCLSEPSEKRRLQRREFTHQIILRTRKHPKSAAERGFFDAKKMSNHFLDLCFCLSFFSTSVFFFVVVGVSSSFARREREIFCTTEMRRDGRSSLEYNSISECCHRRTR